MCRLNPKVDFAFKKLFGSEENKDLLISLINSVLQKEVPIKNIELKNPYNLTMYKKDKLTILDIKAIDENEVWYDIEMQIGEQAFYDKRAIFYLAKTYSNQLESGDDFEKLRKTIGIHILDFHYIDEEAYHNVYKLCNIKTYREFSDLLELHFIELSKFKKEYKDIRTTLDRWIAFLNRAYEIDKNNIPKELAEDRSITKAIEKLDTMYLDKEEKEIYESELKLLRVHKAELKAAEMKGREKGREEGIKKGKKEEKIQIAKSLLDVLDEETIALKTGLSMEDVRGLKS